MMQDDMPVRKISGHVIGQALDDLSIADFDDRIALLKAEIERLEAMRRLKQDAVTNAGSVFR